VAYLISRFIRYISKITTSEPKQQPKAQNQEKSFKDSDIIEAEYYDVPEKKS
jgi:hypothetical protein